MTLSQTAISQVTINPRSKLVLIPVFKSGVGTFRHQPFGRQKFLPISAAQMSPKCPVKHVHIPLVP